MDEVKIPQPKPWNAVVPERQIGLLRPYYSKKKAANDMAEDDDKPRTKNMKSKTLLKMAQLGRKRVSPAKDLADGGGGVGGGGDVAKKKKKSSAAAVDPAVKAAKEAEKARKAADRIEKQKLKEERKLLKSKAKKVKSTGNNPIYVMDFIEG